MKTMVSPSFLSANFLSLQDALVLLPTREADWVQLDVMDGVFVPNISFGFPVIEAINKTCQKPLDVHLMIVNPEKYVAQTAKAGAMLMSVHAEACTHLHRTIQEIHAAGMKAGVALNPSTPLCMVEEVLHDADVILLMSVNPGFGGQTFIEQSVDKVRRLRQMIDAQGSHALIEVDGGVQAETAPRLVEAGANVLVSGSYIFKSANPAETIRELGKL